jgi:F0F1-type ATP synthase gamma subunit
MRIACQRLQQSQGLPRQFAHTLGQSRLAAMRRAEKNIDSLLTNLNRTFYRLRQSSIDEALFDMIAGFNALLQKESGSGR